MIQPLLLFLAQFTTTKMDPISLPYKCYKYKLWTTLFSAHLKMLPGLKHSYSYFYLSQSRQGYRDTSLL